nr:hypothetical protein [uncultured Oscillibacter sp.]
MNNRELRFQDLVSGFRRDWKLFLVIVGGFLLLGLAAGFFFSGRASAEGSGSAQAWEPVDFAEVPMDTTYYGNCYDYIKSQHQVLCSYLDGVRNDSSITEEQQEQLLEMKEEILTFDEDELAPIYWDLNAPDAFYLPDELRQSTLAQYQQERETLLQNISKSEYARSLLDTVGGLSTSDAAVNEIYASILSQAAEYRQLQLDLEQLDSRLNLLENEYPTLRKESDEMAQRLDDAARALDAQAEEVVALLEEIAQENHLNITFSAEQEEVAVQIDHTTRPATRQEAFAAFVLFFGLTGVCVGGFTAVCRVYSSKKENLPQQ